MAWRHKNSNKTETPLVHFSCLKKSKKVKWKHKAQIESLKVEPNNVFVCAKNYYFGERMTRRLAKQKTEWLRGERRFFGNFKLIRLKENFLEEKRWFFSFSLLHVTCSHTLTILFFFIISRVWFFIIDRFFR